MSKRSFRTALVVVAGTVVLVVGIAGWFVHRALSYPDETHEGAGKEVEIEIKPGMSFPAVASMLSTKGVILAIADGVAAEAAGSVDTTLVGFALTILPVP